MQVRHVPGVELDVGAAHAGSAHIDDDLAA
jgi:hypothetical protein